MKLSQQSQSLIESAIRKAISKFPCSCEESVITDIHLQPISGSGELIIFDDNDEELASTIIEEWLTYSGDDFYKLVERSLRATLHKMKDKEEFEKLAIMKPYSFVLVDEDKETVTDLFLIDDETLLVNEELLKGLEEELDSFLKDLLEK